MKTPQQRRAEFPAFALGQIHLDGPGGSQAPQTVIDAVADAMTRSMSNTGWAFPASTRSAETVAGARQAIADLVGGEADGVIFGASMTAITYRLAGAIAATWRAGDEIVVSRLDHDANVRPWTLAAERAGCAVRWADIDPASCELPTAQYDELIGPRTRLVAVTAASNAVGTRPDLPAVVRRAHAHGAQVYLDAVHAAPHGPVDLGALGVDFVACSPYKFFGPHLGCVVASPATLATLHPDKLAPQTDRIPDRFEAGTLPFEMLAGVSAAVDHLASICGDGDEADRPARLRRSMREIETYCDGLFGTLLDGLHALPRVTVYGSAADRAPTLCFRVDGMHPRAVAERIAGRGISLSHGNFFAYELMRRIGLLEAGGAVRVGLLHYNTEEDVRALLAVVGEMVEE